MKRLFMVMAAAFIIFALAASPARPEDARLGYVDLRRSFYEYDKAKSMESELTGLTEDRQETRAKKVKEITKLRDEAELLSGDARKKKQSEIDVKVVDLQEFDRETRQELLTKKNDMFREVIQDIQKVVEKIGKKEGYDYIFDSRNIMYAEKGFDLTDKVIKELNK